MSDLIHSAPRRHLDYGSTCDIPTCPRPHHYPRHVLPIPAGPGPIGSTGGKHRGECKPLMCELERRLAERELHAGTVPPMAPYDQLFGYLGPERGPQVTR